MFVGSMELGAGFMSSSMKRLRYSAVPSSTQLLVSWGVWLEQRVRGYSMCVSAALASWNLGRRLGGTSSSQQ